MKNPMLSTYMYICTFPFVSIYMYLLYHWMKNLIACVSDHIIHLVPSLTSCPCIASALGL